MTKYFVVLVLISLFLVGCLGVGKFKVETTTLCSNINLFASQDSKVLATLDCYNFCDSMENFAGYDCSGKYLTCFCEGDPNPPDIAEVVGPQITNLPISWSDKTVVGDENIFVSSEEFRSFACGFYKSGNTSKAATVEVYGDNRLPLKCTYINKGISPIDNNPEVLLVCEGNYRNQIGLWECK